ncbi:hypothetical protein SASPL_118642 [Salvia splendens]|uniref:Uncharacterized protein n=1 Tax=Salvia splendens TaxID=180675 RepID=A0A8X8Y030_SALSN|nr:hypothetical protein SASPL_118642 [Salvia splendens]
MELHTATVALFLLLCFLLTNAASSHKRSTYIVHMDKPSMPKPSSSHHFWYSSLLKSTNPSLKLLYIYDHAFHGFSVSISQTELQPLKHSPGFVSAYPDSDVTPDTTHTPDFLSLNSASGLWPTSHYGKDVIIGVIDSGIWPESPSFSDRGITTQVPAKWKGVCDGGVGFNSSLCNSKILGARYFNQGWKVSGTLRGTTTATAATSRPLQPETSWRASPSSGKEGRGLGCKPNPNTALPPAVSLISSSSDLVPPAANCAIPAVLGAEAPENSIIVCNITTGDLSDSNVKAVIVITEETSIFRFNAFPHPGVVITAAQGRQVADYALSSDNPTASINFKQTILGKEPRAAPALSSDSSRGPGLNYEGILKPDLMAPGVLILAAFRPQLMAASIGRNIDLATDYNLLAGTSMACPHISGVAALLKAAHPEWSPAMIQSAMMTTANPLDNANQPIRAHDGSVATPFGIGALDPGLVYDASLQDLVNLVSAAEIRRTLTRRFRRSVTNVGDAATYRVMVEAPVNTTVVVRPQTLVFKKKYEIKSYSLTIRYNADIRIQHREGAVIWIDQAGKYRVRSPIMVAAAADNFE